MAEIPKNWRDIIRRDRIDRSAQNISLPESLEDSLEETLITKANQNVDDKIEITSLIRITQNEEYLNQCHNYVFDVQASVYLMRVGLYLYILLRRL